MDSLKFNENICRICLQHNVILDWNEEISDICGMSYKDCYYKYTKLKESGSFCYPTKFCEFCANGLKNAHILFEKALESFIFLQVALTPDTLKTAFPDIKISSSPPSMKCQTRTYDESSEDDCCAEEYVDIKDDISKEFSMRKYEEVEQSHFIDIHNLQLSADAFSEKSDPEFVLVDETNVGKRRKTNEALTETTLEKELKKSYNTELEQSTIAIKKKCKSPGTLIEQERRNKKSQMSTTNQAAKKRKKNIFMCAYCSLKVVGYTQLKSHEATHSEDRLRTETCPQCGIKLYTKVALNNHIKVHDKNRQKNYKCEFCDKAFFNRGALNVHRRIHLGLMVKCLICSKEFYRQIDLDKHLLGHSAAPVQKSVEKLKYTVQCQICNKYVLTTQWKEHKAAHLGQPEVQCKICDKNFYSRSKCVKHLRRLHRKSRDAYDEFIHYYVNCNTRISHLMLKQQEIVKPITFTE